MEPTGPSDNQPPDQSKKPLPKYTTIDLENELPELYSTSLNPNLHDPDLTMFYNHNGPPFYNYKKNSPPPSYPSSIMGRPTSPFSSREEYIKRTHRYKQMLIAFFVVFVIIPFLILLFAGLLPAMHIMQRNIVVE